MGLRWSSSFRPTHTAVDVSHGQLYCGACKDYVYDRDFELQAAKEQSTFSAVKQKLAGGSPLPVERECGRAQRSRGVGVFVLSCRAQREAGQVQRVGALARRHQPAQQQFQAMHRALQSSRYNSLRPC
jgi:hypothetical protein